MKKVDTFRDQGLRNRLVDEIETLGIQDKNVISAMRKVPRHWFLDRAFLEVAYENKAFQIGAGQTISQPLTVAIQSQLLQVKKGNKILEIGTGSAYQTSVLVELGAKVFSIERQKLLFDNAKIMLKELGYKAHLFYGDGYKGKEVYAPFDGIIVTCGAPHIPEKLLLQLKIGARMIIPVGDGNEQTMIEILRTGETDFEKTVHGKFSFVPMLENREFKM